MSKHTSKNTGWWIVGGLVVLMIVLFTASYFITHRKVVVPTIATPDALPGISTSTAPWAPELANLKARLTAINLPALSEEGTVLHTHQHIDIFIDGKQTLVPASIGINDAEGFISTIHVHDNTNVIHVESPTIQTFTLGQFFDIWGVRFTSDCIGGYCVDGSKSLKVFVNGKEYTGDVRQIALEAHQEIVIAYGTDSELPNPIPSSFDFPAGE